MADLTAQEIEDMKGFLERWVDQTLRDERYRIANLVYEWTGGSDIGFELSNKIRGLNEDAR